MSTIKNLLRYNIINGSALDENIYKRFNPLASLIITDPPYYLKPRLQRDNAQIKTNKLYNNKRINSDSNVVSKFYTRDEYYYFTCKWLETSMKYIKSNGLIIVWTNQPGRNIIIESASNPNINYKYVWNEVLWVKPTHKIDENAYNNTPSNNALINNKLNETVFRGYESALVLSNQPKPVHNFNNIYEPNAVAMDYYGFADKDSNDKDKSTYISHPNYKPYSVIKPLILCYSKIDDVILDPFSGSGSIPSAALKLGRKAAAIELDKYWFDIAHQRLTNVKQVNK